jgi:hypothetical protein
MRIYHIDPIAVAVAAVCLVVIVLRERVVLADVDRSGVL